MIAQDIIDLRYPMPALGLWRLLKWQLSPQQLLHWLQSAIALGPSVIDLADIYGSYQVEPLVGEAFALQPALREQLVLISKCGIKLLSPQRPTHTIKHYDTSYAHITASVDTTLRVLHTDRLDVLLLHRPDPLMNADEVSAALMALKQAGKVLHFGVSNFTPAQIELLASRLPFDLITNQVQCSVLHLDPLFDGTLDDCQRRRMSPMAWSPLAGGQLVAAENEVAQRVLAVLHAVGEELNATPDQVALAWLFTHPAKIVPIVGTQNLTRIQSAVAAARLRLSREQWFAVLAAAQGQAVL